MEAFHKVETEVKELKTTTESTKREIKNVKAELDEMRSIITEELTL